MSYKILVVEDDEYNMKILKKILKDENYKVYTQSDGKDAVEKAKWARVHAVFQNIMIAEIEGFNVCQ